MKKTVPIVLGLAVAVIVLVAIGSLVFKPAAKADTLRIGVILPQTGQSAFIGESVRKGMDLALDRHKATGTMPKIELVYEDSAGDVKQAIAAYNKLASVNGVNTVVCVSAGAKALAPLADRDKKVLFCTAVSASNIAAQNPWTFRFFISADVDAKMIGDYAVKKKGYKKLAVVFINDEMGLSYKQVFTETVTKDGGAVVSDQGFNFGVSDYKPFLLKVKDAGADAVYLVGYDDAMARLPVQMKEAGLNIPILSVGTISQPEIMKQAGDTIEGAVYTTCEFNTFAPATDELKSFVEAYKSKYGAPPVFFEVFGYDTLNLLTKAGAAGGLTADAIRSGLLAIRDFQGAAGKITIDSSREVVFPVVLRQIKNGRWSPVDE